LAERIEAVVSHHVRKEIIKVRAEQDGRRMIVK
jgi:hypothetical protein